MVSRIKQIMDDKQLSSSQFATATQIQKSTLSHVLSGRNKPSLDIIIKIVDTYPEINSEWLLKGIGNMYNKKLKPVCYDINDKTKDYDHKPIDDDLDCEVNKKNKDKNFEERRDMANKLVDKCKIDRVVILYKDNTYDTFVK